MQEEPTRRFPKEIGQGGELFKKWFATREEANRWVALDSSGQPTNLLLLLNAEGVPTSERAATLEAVKSGRYKLVPSKKEGKLGIRVVLFAKP